MVVFDTAQTPPAQLYNEKVFCALGRDLDATGALNPDGVTEALHGLQTYARVAQEYQLAKLHVVGTAALRDASNGHQFIEDVKKQTGLSIAVISGDAEARYAALGVLSQEPQARGIIADFGGGSLEFARIAASGDTATPHIVDTISLPLGAFRALAMGDQAEDRVSTALKKLSPRYGQAEALYSIGGSWRSLAQSYLQDMGQYDGRGTGLKGTALQGLTLTNAEMSEFCRKIMAMTPDECRTRYQLEVRRSALAPISAFVLYQVLQVLQPAQLVISTAGIRDGIIFEQLQAAKDCPN